MRNITFIFLISLLSCNKHDLKIENDKYQIVSILFNDLAKPIEPFFPPAYPGEPFTPKDSTVIKLQIEKSKNELNKKKFIIAVVPIFKNSLLKSNELNKRFNKYNNLVSKLNSIKTEEALDLKKIKVIRNDSIILFNEGLLNKKRKEFDKFDYLISFSHVVFSENYNKSVVIVSGSRSKLAGETILYYLIKVDTKWKIYEKKTLEIS